MTGNSIGSRTTGEVERAPFFVVLQQLGRRVLRPGGTAATSRLLVALAIGPRDDVIELAAGVGTTARRLLAAKPRSYLAVEPEDRFAAQLDAVVVPAGGRHVSARAQE
ncbi:MAG: class I SAM-dependent methyltransferase, partial [Acidimicrobiales bacterium]